MRRRVRYWRAFRLVVGWPWGDRVLLHVESVRHAANHQRALRIDDLRLKIVHATPDFLNLKGRAVDRLAFAVEIHPDLVVVLKRRAKCQRYVQYAFYIPQRFFCCR